jgi:methylmalonyl-CoA/ethylmalonyl-CoA epimerase
MGISGVIRIDHVGIAVTSIDAAIANIKCIFRCDVVSREVNNEQEVEEAMIKVGESFLQLLSPTSEASPLTRFLQNSGEGVQQVAFLVSDINLACEQARRSGIRVLYDDWKVGTGGSRINFLHPKDCNGVLIELVQK